MPGNTTPIFTAGARWAGKAIVNADGTALQTLFTAGANGSRVTDVAINSTLPVERHVFLWIELFDDASPPVSLGDFPLGHVEVPPHAGSDGDTPAVAALNDATFLFAQIDRDGNRYLELPANAVLKARVHLAVDSGNQTAPNQNYTGTEANALTLLVTAEDY